MLTITKTPWITINKCILSVHCAFTLNENRLYTFTDNNGAKHMYNIRGEISHVVSCL